MLFLDKDIGDGPLASFLLQVILEFATVLPLVEFEDGNLGIGIFIPQKCFGLL